MKSEKDLLICNLKTKRDAYIITIPQERPLLLGAFEGTANLGISILFLKEMYLALSVPCMEKVF